MKPRRSRRSLEEQIDRAKAAWVASYDRLMTAHEEARRAAAIHARNGERLAKLRQQQSQQGEQL